MNITRVTKTLKQFLDPVAPAWVEDSVPYGASFPYCTYTLNSEEFGGEGLIQVRFFSESTGISEVCSLTDQLEELIGEAGVVLNTGKEYLWLYKGSPFAQLEPTGEDELKAMYIVLNYRIV